MKVLHIISGNDNGGGANHLLNICSKKNIYFKNILGCLGEGALVDKAKEQNINLEVFPKKIFKNNIAKFANENEVDIVNFHGAQPFLIHYFIKRKLNMDTVATIHSDYRYDFLNNKLKYYLYTPLSEMGLNSFENYICVSKNLMDLLEKKQFIGRKTVVNNGMALSKLITRESKEEIRKKLELKEDDFVFTVIGRFHPIKNHINIIKAFHKFNNDYKNSKLILLGDGELRPNIEQLIKELKLVDKVKLVGFVDNVIDYLKVSNASIIASYSEGGAPPLAFLESALVKTPVICTRVGDLEDIVNENNGIIINSQNEKDIYISMEECFDKKEILCFLGENINKLVTQKFTMNNFWKSYYEFYEKVIKDI